VGPRTTQCADIRLPWYSNVPDVPIGDAAVPLRTAVRGQARSPWRARVRERLSTGSPFSAVAASVERRAGDH
jgi:hypothetical protein